MPYRLARPSPVKRRARSAARPAVSALLAVALVANGALAPLAFASARSEIAVGQGPGFSRLDLTGAGSIRRDGAVIVIRFAGAGPNLARLHVDPPPFVKTAEAHTVGGGTEVRITPVDGAVVSVGRADGTSFINLRAPADAAATGDAQKGAARPDPAPANGVVLAPTYKDGVLTLRFPWAAPVGAAVFRRGPTVWIVFDAKAKLNLDGAPRGLTQAKGFEAVEADNATALRFTAPADLNLSAKAEGAVWSVTLGGPARPAPSAPSVSREEDGSAGLVTHVAGAGSVIWLRDPQVGDRLAAVTSTGAVATAAPRRFVDARVLASAQGLALEAVADDLLVSVEKDRVSIGRPKGLALSQAQKGPHDPAQAAPQPEPLDLPKAAALPGLIDFAGWSKTGDGGFLKRYDALLTAAADEAAGGKAAGLEARLGLARFLVGSQLAQEAIGVLDTLAKTNPQITASGEFRGLRGAARVMARRWKDAEADFSAPAIVNDPGAALWRGYAAAMQGDAATAKARFLQGRVVLDQVAPIWRARFGDAAAGAAVTVGDASAAHTFLSAGGEAVTPQDKAEQGLVRARLDEAEGRVDDALGLYDHLTDDSYGAVAARALLKATDLRLAKGKLTTPQAIATLDSIRYRWRGDATELEVVRELGQVNLRQGRYREALEAWRSSGSRMPDIPVAAEIRADLSQAFKDLFLGGRADGLEPIQALALFYDFKDYTPIGADGDLMVRRLVRRLVDVDLLDQAADLLKYQVANRLEGPAKAQVATDLALVQLMNRKPEDALGAINDSRSTLLPTAMNLQRRLIEARALIDLNRRDHALEVLGEDPSPDAVELRALAAWQARDWPSVAKFSEARLGDRWKRAQPLTTAEAAFLLRAGVAMSLANDEAGLARLRDRYGRLVDTAPNPEAMRVALAGVNTTPGSGLLTAVSDADAFAGWVVRMKERFRAAADAPPPPRQQVAATPAAASKKA